ncbi:hypothetical protein Q5530_33690 [Saccharothrix sp. BKS2]|uniref:hypothetical protein n=1 Tax=Saccharothrix sp. BKS2 TaxID=3064400 RepID=UPI0039E79E50
MSRRGLVWWPVAATVVPVCLLFAGVSAPGGYFFMLSAAFVAWFAVGVAWAAGAWRVVKPLPPPRSGARTWWSLLVVPAIFATSWAVASGNAIGRVAFALHRPALERLAAEAPTSPPWSASLYSFEHLGHWQGCTTMGTSDPATTREAGLLWCPGRSPGTHWDGEGLILTPIEDDWYVYHHGGRSNDPAGTEPWGLDLDRFGRRIET